MVLGSSTARRGQFFDALATALDAGMTPEQALSLMAGSKDRVGTRAAAAARLVAGGADLPQALARSGAGTAFEAEAVRAGESAGRTPQVLRRLSAYCRSRAEARRGLAVQLVYPAFLTHAAILLPNLPWIVSHDFGTYLTKVLPTLAILYGLGFVAWVVIGRLPSGTLAALPIVGPLRKLAAGAHYATLLGLVLESGVPLGRALARAGSGSAEASQPFSLAVGRIRMAVERGAQLSAAVERERAAFPKELIQAVVAGEASGRLPQTLSHAGVQLREDFERRLQAVLKLASIFVYIALAAWVAIIVIRWYGSFYAGIG